MNTRDFLACVLGDSGFYCAFGAKFGTKIRKQKFYKSIDELLDTTLRFDENELDAYFALATFEEDSKRTKANAAQMGSLFLDLDCGPEKEFPSQGSALAALKVFAKVLGMPKPLVVNSGRGLHVYWPLEEAVPVADWLPVAQALKRACVANEFPADPAVPADAARILRVPGTYNRKGDTPLKVEVLAFGSPDPKPLSHFSELLDGYAPGITDMFSGNSLMGTSTDTTDRLINNKPSSFKQILQKTMVGKGCAQIKHIAENPADVEEPLWRAGLSIAKFCTDGEKGAHAISRGHPGYSEDATDEKMEGIVGPYTCEQFDNLRPGTCDGCPLAGKFKSPIALGKYVEEAGEDESEVEAPNAETGQTETFNIPTFPKPYFRGQGGGIFVKARDEEGDPYDDCVYVNDLYFVRRVYDKDEGESLVARLHLPHDGVREFTVSLGQATSSEELRKVLSSRGVVANGKKSWEKIMTYANSWVSKLQSDTVADTAHRQFGWTDDDTLESFVWGSKEIFGDRIEYNPPTTSTAGMMPAFTVGGTLDGWVEQMNFFNRPGMEPFQFMVCLTLAAPLVALTPYNAAMFTLFSDASGRGKTTAQKIGLAAFGDPNEMMMQATDTVNFRMNRMEVLKNLPAQWDEVTNIPAETVSDMVYQIQTGKQKGRMAGGANTERVTGRPWKTSCGFTSNESLIEKIRHKKGRPEGETQRILEYHAQEFNFANKAETDALSKEVGKHYGHAAVPFVQHIINNKVELLTVMETVQRQIDNEAKLVQKDRFWSMTAAVVVTAAMVGRKLGLLNYDPKVLRDWSTQLILDNKRQSIEATADIRTHITNYISENYGNILWIKSTDDLRSDTSSGEGLDSLVTPEQNPRMKFVARFETDTKKLFLLPKPFQSWCAGQHLNFDSVVKELKDEMGGVRKKVRFSKGTKFDLPTTTAIVVDCTSVDVGDGSQED